MGFRFATTPSNPLSTMRSIASRSAPGKLGARHSNNIDNSWRPCGGFSNIAHCRSLWAKRPIIPSHTMENCFNIPPSLVYVARSKSASTGPASLMWSPKYRTWRISVAFGSSCAILTSSLDDEANQFRFDQEVSLGQTTFVGKYVLAKAELILTNFMNGVLHSSGSLDVRDLAQGWCNRIRYEWWTLTVAVCSDSPPIPVVDPRLLVDRGTSYGTPNRTTSWRVIWDLKLTDEVGYEKKKLHANSRFSMTMRFEANLSKLRKETEGVCLWAWGKALMWKTKHLQESLS